MGVEMSAAVVVVLVEDNELELQLEEVTTVDCVDTLVEVFTVVLEVGEAVEFAELVPFASFPEPEACDIESDPLIVD